MRVVDTSAWIEWLVASPTGTTIAAEVPEREAWLVPTIVQLELGKWLNREAGEDKADQVIAFTEMCVVLRSIPRSRLPPPNCVPGTGFRRRMRSFMQQPCCMMPTC
ncbi:MAG TPA: PIN domain-containing protein [Acetobacteraceae bacterium]|jgi:predicted nucleic acid-binding protein